MVDLITKLQESHCDAQGEFHFYVCNRRWTTAQSLVATVVIRNETDSSESDLCSVDVLVPESETCVEAFCAPLALPRTLEVSAEVQLKESELKCRTTNNRDSETLDWSSCN